MKTMPRANQEVFQALAERRKALPEAQRLPEVGQVQGQLEEGDHDPADDAGPEGGHREILAEGEEERDEVETGTQSREDLGQPDEQSLALDPLGLRHGLDHPLMGDHPLAISLSIHAFPPFPYSQFFLASNGFDNS